MEKIYRGETIVGDFVLKDDEGQTITHIDGAVILLTDMRSKVTPPVIMRLGDGITFDAGAFRFVVASDVTKTLPDMVGFEIKIVVNGLTRIATKALFQVIGNQVKDYS